ncbi:MAG: hypothetical protein ACKPCM_16035 [Pseudanabaena sp.]
MELIKGFGLVILAVVVLILGSALVALLPKSGAAVKALPQAKIAGYLMPVREAAAVTVDYSKFNIRELKAMARGTGIKSWEKLRKAELVAALSLI